MGNTLFENGVKHSVYLDKVFHNETVKHCTVALEKITSFDQKEVITLVNGTFLKIKAGTVNSQCYCCFTKTHKKNRVFINVNPSFTGYYDKVCYNCYVRWETTRMSHLIHLVRQMIHHNDIARTISQLMYHLHHNQIRFSVSWMRPDDVDAHEQLIDEFYHDFRLFPSLPLPRSVNITPPPRGRDSITFLSWSESEMYGTISVSNDTMSGTWDVYQKHRDARESKNRYKSLREALEEVNKFYC